MWDILDFIINAVLFVLIGLQLREVIDGLSGYSASTLGGYALAVAGWSWEQRSCGYSPCRNWSVRSTGARPSEHGAWERGGAS